MRHWHRSIYFNLFIALIIIILPLQVAQFAMYRWGREAVTEELNSAASSNVVYLRDHFVDNIKSINVQLEFLLVNTTITSFFVNHDRFAVWEYYTAADQIINLLTLIKNSNTYFSEIILYYTPYNVALSSDNRLDDIKTEEITHIISEFREQHSLLMEADEQMIVGHMVPSTAYFKDVLPQYFVQAVLSEDAVKEHLSSFSQYSNKNAFMINHNTGTVISSSESTLDESAGLSALVNLITPRENETVYSDSVTLNDQPYIVVACYSSLINSSFVQLIPAKTLQTIPDRFAFFVKMFFVLAIVVFGLFLFIMYRLVKRPMNDMVRAFSMTGEGNFDRHLDENYASYEYNELALRFNNMVERIKRLIQTNYEQTIRLQRSELKQLQAQINPHFLYNSFFLLRHMIGRGNNKQAKTFTSYLGKYFQYITKSGMDLVPLKLEYEHASNYLTIQMMRFEEGIRFDAEPLPDEFGGLMVPKLILQPIFENILVHGGKKVGLSSRIRLSFSQEDEGLLHIIVEDNGDQLTDEKLTDLKSRLGADTPINETSGLINIHKRLELHFGAGCGLIVSRSALGGLRIQMTLATAEPEEE